MSKGATASYFANQQRHGRSVTDQELGRILGLVRKHEINDDDADLFSAERMRPEMYFAPEQWRINPFQVAMTREYLREGGVFSTGGVGCGKTLACFLIANEAYLRGVKKIIYFIPASAAEQTALQQLPFARRMIYLAVPVHFLAGRSWTDRLHVAKSGGAGLYVVNYSHLSRPETNDVLAAINPELVIADEAHRLKNPRAALTKRVFAMLDAVQPQFATMSGTFSNKGLKQFHHHLVRALGDKAPIPMTISMTNTWAEHIDSDAFGDLPNYPKSLEPLVTWAKDNFPKEVFGPTTESLRRAFRLRLNSSPGVVSSIGDSTAASLIVDNQPVEGLEQHPDWPKVVEQLKVVDEGKTPEGDVIEHAIHAYKWKKELNAGFYYSLKWPTVDHMLRYNMAKTKDEAAERLVRSQLYHEQEEKYRSLLRTFLAVSALGLDTPMDVGNSMARHGSKYVPEELYDEWKKTQEMDFPGRIKERLKSAVHLCDGKYVAAVDWAQSRPKDDRGGLIWYANRAVGLRAVEYLEKAGMSVLYCPGGAKHNAAIIDPANGGKICVASLKAHSEVKNLQHFGDQYYLQIARDATIMEQAIGRTHRQGQKRDEITVTTALTTKWDHEEWSAMLSDSLFAHQTLGTRRRVVFAQYVTMPRIFSPEYLAEAGFQPRMLTKEQKEMFRTYFGVYEK